MADHLRRSVLHQCATQQCCDDAGDAGDSLHKRAGMQRNPFWSGRSSLLSRNSIIAVSLRAGKGLDIQRAG